MTGESIPTETVTRKPDADVGSECGPAAGGGRQTPQQAAITAQGPGGLTDTERGEAGAGAYAEGSALGGSSDGQSDRMASGGPEAGEPVAKGHYKVEKERDQGRSSVPPR